MVYSYGASWGSPLDTSYYVANTSQSRRSNLGTSYNLSATC